MTPQEIRKLQPGNIILIDDMVAIVLGTTIIPAGYPGNPTGHNLRTYTGTYMWEDGMEGPVLGWFTTDSPEYNKDLRLMPLDQFHGLPIQGNFEEINGVNLYNDPNAAEIYGFVHLYQNEWNRLNEPLDEWKLPIVYSSQIQAIKQHMELLKLIK